ncbi:MAG: hypothetical protein IH892_12840 [Planctomycetes bacterium]|nr:hypothetical protein [Planctomycetota bacterium]
MRWYLPNGVLVIGFWAVLCFGQTTVAMSFPLGAPAVAISVSVRSIKLDSAWSLGMYRSETTLDVHVLANGPHEVGISFEGFANRNGFRIRREDVSVVVNGVQVGPRPVSVTASTQATPASGVHVPIDLGFAVRNMQTYPAGRYYGVVAFQVMATP